MVGEIIRTDNEVVEQIHQNNIPLCCNTPSGNPCLNEETKFRKRRKGKEFIRLCDRCYYE